MARKDYQGRGEDIFDDIQEGIGNTNKKVSRVRNDTRPVVPRYNFATDNPGDKPLTPSEGQIAVGADDNKLYYYVNGEWRTPTGAASSGSSLTFAAGQYPSMPFPFDALDTFGNRRFNIYLPVNELRTNDTDTFETLFDDDDTWFPADGDPANPGRIKVTGPGTFEINMHAVVESFVEDHPSSDYQMQGDFITFTGDIGTSADELVIGDGYYTREKGIKLYSGGSIPAFARTDWTLNWTAFLSIVSGESLLGPSLDVFNNNVNYSNSTIKADEGNLQVRDWSITVIRISDDAFSAF